MVVDSHRTIAAKPLDWDEWYIECPTHGEPGSAGMFLKYHDSTGDHLMFACPGCGQFSPIRVGVDKPSDAPSWCVTTGRVDDVKSLSLVPSIHSKYCCGWHGYLTDGIFRSC